MVALIIIVVLVAFVIALIVMRNNLVVARQRVKMLGARLMYNFKEDLI